MKLTYSKEAKDRIRALAPEVKKGIREVLELFIKDPYLGKPLQRELIGFSSLRFKRYRIIYKVISEKKQIYIVTLGRRERVYEDLLRQIN